MNGCPFSPVLDKENCVTAKAGFGDSPTSLPHSILRPSNIINIQTPLPINKNLKVSFQTPAQGTTFERLPSDSPYNAVRELDEKERWSERATVVTKQDHEDYLTVAADILNQIIDNLPLSDCPPVASPSTSPADQLNTEQNLSAQRVPATQLSPIAGAGEEQTPSPVEGGITMEEDTSALPPPPEPARKNIYELSEEDLVNMNPFQSTNKMQNSPPIRKRDMSDNRNQPDGPDFDFENIKDPFGTSSKVDNSPIVTKSPNQKKRTPKKKTPSPSRDPDPTPSPEPPALGVEEEEERVNGEVSPPSPEDVSIQSPQINGATKEEEGGQEGKGVQMLLSTGGDGDSGVASAEERHPDEMMPSFDAQGGIPDVIEDDEFRPATEVFANSDPAAFDVDFLEKAGGKSDFQESALARQSLYVKFDPLVKGCPTPPNLRGPLQPLEPEGGDLLQMKTPSPSQILGGGNTRAQKRAEVNLRASTSPDGTTASQDQVKNVDSLLSCSPTLPDAQDVIDGANMSEVSRVGAPRVTSSDEGIVQLLRYSQTDMDAAVLEAARAATVKAQKAAEEKYNEYEKRLQASNEKLNDSAKTKEILEKSSSDMRALIVEYEKSIQQLMDDASQAKVSSEDSAGQLEKEKEQALEDLASVESAFSDLHRRYEKLKVTLDGYRKNEEMLKNKLTDYQSKVKKQEQRYQTLKSHAEEKIKEANEQITKATNSFQAEIAALQASLKREQLNVESQEKTIQQKAKEFTELTKFCDELIARLQSAAK